MSQALRLYNSFTRTTNTVKISGQLIHANRGHYGKPIYGSLYICGPTVYSDSHIGHAITYIRADLIRRFMASIFNVKLVTVMNITDIDDKILDKTRKIHDKDSINETEPRRHPFSEVSDQYFNSFLKDMSSVKVLPADLYVRVSKSIGTITSFIGNLEKLGHTYTTDSGDVLFRVNSVKNYVGLDAWSENHEDTMTHGTVSMKDDRKDFVLWKAAKPGEPVWYYHSPGGKVLPGRPGWHVQCSAISSAIFGSQLDFHFGGKDLKFPHNYNEEACCCAFHQLDTSESLHVWSKNWLHFGHMVLQDKKMSKSLGNVVPVKSFIDRASTNALRLLCIKEHYRADITFDADLQERVKSLDHKISAFVSYLAGRLSNIQNDIHGLDSYQCEDNRDVETAVDSTYRSIIDGVCDDFRLDAGLDSIMELSKLIYSKGGQNLKPRDLVATWHLVNDWCSICCLDYGHLDRWKSANELDATSLLQGFREKIRQTTLDHLKKFHREMSPEAAEQVLCSDILKECDIVRAKMDELGFVIRDPKS